MAVHYSILRDDPKSLAFQLSSVPSLNSKQEAFTQFTKPSNDRGFVLPSVYPPWLNMKCPDISIN